MLSLSTQRTDSLGVDSGEGHSRRQRTQPPGVSVLPEKEGKVDESIPEQLEWDCLEAESVYEGVPRSDGFVWSSTHNTRLVC